MSTSGIAEAESTEIAPPPTEPIADPFVFNGETMPGMRDQVVTETVETRVWTEEVGAADGSPPRSPDRDPTYRNDPATPPYSAASPGSPPPESQQLSDAGAIIQGTLHSELERVQLAREVDVRAAFAGLPRVHSHWTHRYMKILVVGEAGVGKTTFIKNLFAAYASDPKFPVADTPARGARKAFQDNPESLCTEVVLQDVERRVCYHYRVQDTPAFGDGKDLDSDQAAVLDHIRACNQAFLDAEQDPGRRSPLASHPDPRVDACLYFFPPHTCRANDLEFARLLAAAVPLIPVLAKADAMTSEELAGQRARVARALARHGAQWTFSPRALAEAGAHDGPPFAVVGSRDMDLAVGRFWPVRRYPWGRVEALLTRHSDLPALRRLLFEAAFEDLKENTDARYLDFRRDQAAPGIVAVVTTPVRGLVKLAEWGFAVAAVLWLSQQAGPLLTDPKYRQRKLEDVREKVDTLATNVRETADEVRAKSANAVGTAKEAAQNLTSTTRDAAHRANRVLEKNVTSRERRMEQERRLRYESRPFWRFWGE
uniref:Septin-type G domain-containing protein n=1 Tax=Auxenochlorella protothecoides TaxID=3075 RepID=A0A1D1ZRQ5_AUXPR